MTLLERRSEYIQTKAHNQKLDSMLLKEKLNFGRGKALILIKSSDFR